MFELNWIELELILSNVCISEIKKLKARLDSITTSFAFFHNMAHTENINICAVN